MADDVLRLADRLWAGEEGAEIHHLFSATPSLVEVGDGSAFVAAFANASVFRTERGLVMVDTGSFFSARAVHDEVRRWTAAPLHTAIYSHGHVDHVFGVPLFEEEATAHGWAAPRVVAPRPCPPASTAMCSRPDTTR